MKYINSKYKNYSKYRNFINKNSPIVFKEILKQATIFSEGAIPTKPTSVSL